MGQNHLNDNMIFNYCCAKLTKEFQIAYVDKDVYHWWWIRRVSQVTKWGAVQLHLTSFLLLLLLESTLKMKYTCKDIYYWSLVKQTNKLSMLILMHPVAWLMIHVWHEKFFGYKKPWAPNGNCQVWLILCLVHSLSRNPFQSSPFTWPSSLLLCTFQDGSRLANYTTIGHWRWTAHHVLLPGIAICTPTWPWSKRMAWRHCHQPDRLYQSPGFQPWRSILD